MLERPPTAARQGEAARGFLLRLAKTKLRSGRYSRLCTESLVELQGIEHGHGQPEHGEQECPESDDNLQFLRDQNAIRKAERLTGKDADSAMEVPLAAVREEHKQYALDGISYEDQDDKKKDYPSQYKSLIVERAESKPVPSRGRASLRGSG
jgi:hypothetical protein